jgi:dihydroorotate dehydrogenase electron transfer subunit
MTHFADCANQLITPLLRNERVAKDTMLLRVSAPEMARQVVPGQFFMVRIPGCNDPLIGRAFALYACSADEGWIEVVYLVKGKLTTRLALLPPGADIAIWGPLGNGFSTAPVDQLIMVAGGIGQTPFLSLAREALGRQSFGSASRVGQYAQRVHFCYGVRSRDYLSGVTDFENLGIELSIATDDGSVGPARRVTDALIDCLEHTECSSRRVVCCGPEPMMEAVSRITAERSIPCEVSLETPMACGVGICFTCVAKIGCEQDWDYKRTCVEGPIFNAAEIVW